MSVAILAGAVLWLLLMLWAVVLLRARPAPLGRRRWQHGYRLLQICTVSSFVLALACTINKQFVSAVCWLLASFGVSAATTVAQQIIRSREQAAWLRERQQSLQGDFRQLVVTLLLREREAPGRSPHA